MKLHVVLPIVLGSLVVAPGLAPADLPPGPPPSPSPETSASAPPADASAPPEDAGADAAAAAPKLDDIKYFALEPPKEEKTPPPKAKEWAEAPETKLVRGSSNCRVFRVREWIKINCTTVFGARADVVAGNGNDVYFSLREGIDCSEGTDGESLCSTVTDMVFPLRRGDRRAIQISAVIGGYGGPGLFRYRASVFISETWLEDDPGPIVTITDAR